MKEIYQKSLRLPSLTGLFFRGILPSMKGFWSTVVWMCVTLAVLEDSASAQSNQSAGAVRRYDRRVQMHASPSVLQVPGPDSPQGPSRGLLPSIDVDPSAFSALSSSEPQVQVNGPRRKTITDKQQKQNKNWILPSVTETGESDEDGESRLDSPEESSSSGWGWLADDLRARQRKEKDAQEKEDSKNKEEQESSTLRMNKDAPSSADGIFLDTAFKPVSGSIPTKKDESKREDNTAYQDHSGDHQESRVDGPTTIESPQNRSAAEERKFGVDATWGNENLWKKNEQTPSLLPQTEALLSSSKFEAKESIWPSARPSFKSDLGNAGVAQVEPGQVELSSPKSITASGFQPLPAAPVADLGNASWKGDLSGSSPFADSTPLSQSPAATPSSSGASLKAPELPQPITSPWLR